MRSSNDIRHARDLMREAQGFLIERREGGSAVCLTAEFHAGAQYALNWVLQDRNYKAFQKHLEMLDKERETLTQGAIR